MGQQNSLRTGTAAILLLLLCGCGKSTGLPSVTTADRQVATEASQMIEAALRALPEDDPLIGRYGRFVSMTPATPVRERAQKDPLGPGGFPAHLHFRLPCVFEKFPAKIDVTVFNDGSAKQPELVHQPEVFILGPTPDALRSTAFDAVPTLREDELWFIREGGGQAEIRSTIGCWIQHPKFVP